MSSRHPGDAQRTAIDHAEKTARRVADEDAEYAVRPAACLKRLPDDLRAAVEEHTEHTAGSTADNTPKDGSARKRLWKARQLLRRCLGMGDA